MSPLYGSMMLGNLKPSGHAACCSPAESGDSRSTHLSGTRLDVVVAALAGLVVAARASMPATTARTPPPTPSAADAEALVFTRCSDPAVFFPFVAAGEAFSGAIFFFVGLQACLRPPHGRRQLLWLQTKQRERW